MFPRLSPRRGLLLVARRPRSRARCARTGTRPRWPPRLTSLVRETAPAVQARRADLLARSAAVDAAAPVPAPILNAEVENIPDGVRIDQAQQMRLGAEFLIFRGNRADALRSAAERRRDGRPRASFLSSAAPTQRCGAVSRISRGDGR